MITRKSPEEIDCMRRAGRLVGHTLSTLVEAARPGVSLLDLDALAERVIREGGGIPSFLGYHGDAAVTVPIGRVDEAARRLIETTERAMWAGIAQARPSNRLSDIGHAVEQVASAPGYGVVREYVGHGIGTRMHEEPQVPNYGRPGRGLRLDVGLALAIEPMVNEGGPETEVLEDGWTVVTRDGSRSAHFEHTVAITPHGPEVLTLLDGIRQEDWLPTAAQRR